MTTSTRHPLAEPASVRAALVRLGVSEDFAVPVLSVPRPDEVTRHLLATREDSADELVLVAWGHNAQSGMHGHGISRDDYTVVHGAVEEYRPDGAEGWLIRNAGETVSCPTGCRHDVRCANGVPALTLHRYHPRLADAQDAMLATPLHLDGTDTEALGNVEDEAPDRPWIVLNGSGEPSEAVHARHRRIAEVLGTPLRIAAQSAGVVVDVVPRPRFADDTVPSYRNALAFAFHSELPYLAYPPSYVLLTALVNEMDCATLVSPAAAVGDLPGDVINQLRRPAYRFAFPPYWERTSAPALSLPRPAVAIDAGGFRIRCRFDNVVAADAAAAAASEMLFEAFAARAERVRLQPGDTLAIRNRWAVHGREMILPGARHLLKSYVWNAADIAIVDAAGFLQDGLYAEFL